MKLFLGTRMLRSIQILRAFAVWFVVLHHIRQIAFADHFSSPFMDRLAHKGAAGVDLFFVISGFIICHSVYRKPISAIQFAINRAIRIIPAYWFFTGIVALLSIYFNGLMFATNLNPELLIKSLLFLPTERTDLPEHIPFLTVGWTLNYEMLFYLLVSLVILISRERFIPLISFCIIFSYEYLKPSLSLMPFYGNGMTLEFLLGIFIADFYKNGYISNIRPQVLILFAFASILFIYNQSVDHDVIYTGVPCAIIVASFVGLESIIKDSLPTRLVIKLGNYSYSTYLCHIIIICALTRIENKFINQKDMIMILTVPLTLLVSILSYKFVEQPTTNLAKYFFNKRDPVTT